MELTFDPAKTPFSRRGSWLALRPMPDGRTLRLHNARRRFGEDEMFDLVFTKNGEPVSFTAEAEPGLLTLRSPSGTARLVLHGATGLVVETEGFDWSLRLFRHFGYGIEERSGRFKILSSTAHNYSVFHVQVGKGRLEGPPETLPSGQVRSRDSDGWITAVEGRSRVWIEVSNVEPDPRQIPPVGTIQALAAEARADWEEFIAPVPPPEGESARLAILAWYNLWSCFVPAEGSFSHDAVIMSKVFMCSVWSWDHCFNALALVSSHPDTALQQFLLPFAHQAPNGALPDCFSPNQETIWAVTKAPVHGWCFGLMLDRHDFDEITLRHVYRYLEGWTDYWLIYRDSDQDGIPEVPMGCDAWDNATVYDLAFFIESPDLASHLILQMQTLSRIAVRLGDEQLAAEWRAKAAALLQRLIDHSWTGDCFVAPRSRTHEKADGPRSLATVMPIVLGDLLPEAIFSRLVEILDADFLTPCGLATEAPSSSFYGADDYWRGPIWAPVILLAVDGLRRGGRADLAREIARRFCNAIRLKAEGHYENFDALTGKGLRAPGYSWTASVHLVLLDFLNREPGENP